ncbi:dihydropteroate synthase [Jatrophihabitans telluris]|uniref:Dihydropteroate synthase n=1 Tax=Jatrophihabitans telluris TaxID=2038343 RepID=A0ABY4QZL6_9ACTN|nr:dihydropteroate synthase [Jatrophihabitans telluris]UQX88915.1 dihydropteroate synthase [Jatrophihabitans telluris]
MLPSAASALPTRSDRIVVMGVLNVTPDSFSDGGRYADLDAAVAHAEEMVAAGADLIDVGGESTRPGAQRVSAEVEAARVVPVIQRLAQEGIKVSVDTYRAAVAELSLAAGAMIVNDVSGGLGDADMARVVSDARCPWIIMHWRGHSDRMAELARYDDVVLDVKHELLARVDDAVKAGVEPEQLVLDPGLGFAKSAEHNWRLLAHIEEFTRLDLPVLLGASRKSFLGRLLADPDGEVRATSEREDATTALTMFAALQGAWGVRVHEVRPSVDAALAAAAIKAAR